MVHILDDITGFQPGAVANKNNYIKCITRYLFENVNCSSNICKQQNRSVLADGKRSWKSRKDALLLIVVANWIHRE